MKIVRSALVLILGLLLVLALVIYSGIQLSPLTTEALVAVIATAAIVALYCFVAGELTGNFSQVDKLWSLVPIVYLWIIACYGDFSWRLVIMSSLVTAWGLRLTYNFSLKDAYHWKFWQGEEDYRWQILRAKPEFQPKWKWTVFNLGFISGYQNALILMMTLPAIIALQFNQRPLGPLDLIAATLMLCFIGYETVADWQQWNYQRNKWQLIHAGQTLTGNYRKGFLDSGLWSRSRHPNYFAEQAIWCSFYLFSVAASGQWFKWSIAGSLLLILLFQGSSRFSEEISAGKYPEYENYQSQVPRFVPRLRSKII